MSLTSSRRSESGSIIIYILIAIFLTGLLVAAMTTGAKKSASSGQVMEAFQYLQSDIKTVQQSVNECMEVYSKPVDRNGDGTIDATDNPNPPFPMYCADSTCALSSLSSGTGGTPVANIGCPGAPDGQRVIFGKNVNNNFKLLGNTSAYTTTFFNTAAEGVFIRITPSAGSSVWSETLTRLDGAFSKCAASAVVANPDPLGFDCSSGCFYYWIVRNPTSSASFEASCP